MGCTNHDRLRVVYGDFSLGVHGENFSYIFSYGRGGLESLVTNGHEWLYRTPKPTFWRALTDNDRGNKFHLRSGMWLSADQFADCVGAKVYVDGEPIPFPGAPDNNQFDGTETAEQIGVRFTFQTITVPKTEVDVTYTVHADGRITVDVQYHGKKGLPELPVFGLRFIMPTKAVSYTYEGLSGETYPDRMAGGVPGVYEVEGLPVTKYLVPQECGMHMDTKWVEITRKDTLSNVRESGDDTAAGQTFSLRFAAADKNFAFSCLPYTAQELENATHHEELPIARRTVLCICGAVRGVGGIDSWGADVEPAYHIDAEKDMEFSFEIRPM